MTDQERKTVGEYWFGLAQMYGKEIPRVAMKIMLDSISDLPSREVLIALEEWSKNSKQNRHPLPGEVRELLKKELSVDSKANEAANRIRLAITRVGWANPKEAREFIGELGWSIVERFGGWVYVCENHGVDLNPLTFHAQARDSAKSILEQESLGVFGKPIQIGHQDEKRLSSGGLEKANLIGLLEKK